MIGEYRTIPQILLLITDLQFEHLSLKQTKIFLIFPDHGIK